MKQIILVEDDPAICDGLSIFFETMGIKTTVYHNGNNILAGSYELPDLFLLDKQLSGVDGLDICQYLKSKPESKDIPVIMMSASPSVIKLGKVAGADDVIIKPYKLTDMQSLLSKYLS